jgi:CspA family cold shock protein
MGGCLAFRTGSAKGRWSLICRLALAGLYFFGRSVHKISIRFTAYVGCLFCRFRLWLPAQLANVYAPIDMLLWVTARSLRREHSLEGLAMITGTVKFFNTTKGFGFISPENGDKDAFVHISAVQRSGLQGLYEGDKVTFELETGRDGKVSATNLTLLD